MQKTNRIETAGENYILFCSTWKLFHSILIAGNLFPSAGGVWLSCRWCKHFDILNFDAGTWRETPIWIVHEKLKHKCAQWEINFFCFGPMCYQTICSSDQSIAWLTSMLVLNILPLIVLFQEGLCASELLTILPDSTSGIKACNASGIGSFTRRRWKIPSSAQNFHSSVVQKGDCELECRRRRHFGIPWREGHVQAPDPQKWIWIRGSSSTYLYFIWSKLKA